MNAVKILSLLLTLVLFPLSILAQIEENEAIDSLFQEWNKPDTPGCAVGIIKDGDLIYSKGYGLANLEQNIPISPNSIFRVGYLSKQFTAACIVLLAERGKLSLEDSLKKFFPDFPDYSKNITIRNLLNHTSGIMDYGSIAYLKGLSIDGDFKDKDIMNWLVNQKELDFAPGEEFRYSNSGYWLLGQIANQVSGMNMADFAQKEIFDPLGMSDTRFQNDYNKINENQVIGYRSDKDVGYKVVMTSYDIIGPYGMRSTINDLKKWDDEFYNMEVFDFDFWSTMIEKGTLSNGKKINFANGLFIGNYRGLQTISYLGGFAGFRSTLLRFSSQRVSIVIFANLDIINTSALSYKVADIILQDVLKAKKVNKKPQETISSNRYIELSNLELEAFTGHYWNEKDLQARKIYVKKDTLRYYRNEKSESPLVPISKNSFQMIDADRQIIVMFEKDEEKNEILSFYYIDRDALVLKKFEPPEYSNEDLDMFTGQYYNTDLEVHYTLKKEENQLMLYVDTQKKSVLKPIKSLIFTNEQYGIFQFNQNEAKGIDGFTLIGERWKNLKFNRQIQKPE